MNWQEKQKKFDDVKWYDSVIAKQDKCGSYSFCYRCYKEEPYPCARAAERAKRGGVRIATIRRVLKQNKE